MFEIGTAYSLKTLEDGQTSFQIYEVVDWQQPLLKVSDSRGKLHIFNTASATFISASIPEASVYEKRGFLEIF